MKILLIIPPISLPNQYHLAAPLLAGQLEIAGYEAFCLDANIGFFNNVLTQKNIKNCTKYLDNQYKNLCKKFKNISDESKLVNPAEIEKYHFYKKLLDLYKSEEDMELVNNSHKYIKSALNVLRDKKKFYDIKILNRTFNLLNLATNIISHRYDNFRFSLHGTVGYDEKLMNLEYLDKYINSEFAFSEYYKKIVNEIKRKKPELTGISISYEEQVIPSLKLAYLLKKHTKTKVLLGGSHISRIIEKLPNKNLMFEKYCDFVIQGNGERAIVELCQYLEGKISPEQVSNLIYKDDNNKIITNTFTTIIYANEVKPVSLKGINSNEYLSPEIVAPLQLSKGCYWGKCTFCTHTLEKKYSIKNLDFVIEELKSLRANGITKFTIVDEAISPHLLNSFADALIENNLDVKYMIDARFENGFNSELFEKAYRSGLRFILWGFETGNERIHTLMNKDVCFANRKNILKAAAENNIFNHLFVFHGFPTARLEEEKETLQFINENHSIIGSFVTNAFFVLSMDSVIANNPESFGIKIINKELRPDFSNSYSFEGNCLSQNDKDKISELSMQIRQEKFNYYTPLYIRENLLLYLSHFEECEFKTQFSKPPDNLKLR